MEIYKPGSPVFLTGSGIQDSERIRAHVNGSLIRATGVTYEVAWFDGRTRHEKWLTEAELRPDHNSEKQTVGFKGATSIE